MDVDPDSRNGGAASGDDTGGASDSFMGLTFFLEGLMRILHEINGGCLGVKGLVVGGVVVVVVVEKWREPCIARDMIEEARGVYKLCFVQGASL